MYLERIKNKLGSTHAKISTGKSKTVKRLARKKGGCIKRSKHVMGGNVPSDVSGDTMYAMGGDELARKKGGSVKRSKRAMGGITPAPYAAKLAPTAAKLGHKKGKRIKREKHYIGAMLGALSAASAIPGIIDLVKKIKH
jgi:hypothetical protein